MPDIFDYGEFLEFAEGQIAELANGRDNSNEMCALTARLAVCYYFHPSGSDEWRGKAVRLLEKNAIMNRDAASRAFVYELYTGPAGDAAPGWRHNAPRLLGEGGLAGGFGPLMSSGLLSPAAKLRPGNQRKACRPELSDKIPKRAKRVPPPRLPEIRQQKIRRKADF